MIRWNPEADAALLLMNRSGCPYRQMAGAMQVSVTAVRRRLVELDAFEERPLGRPVKQWTVPQDKTLIAMRQAGKGYRTIAKQVGASKSAVAKRVAELGLPGDARKLLTDSENIF